MPPVRVVTVCGSLQARSGNLALLESLPGLAPCDVEFSAFTGLRALPHFDLDLNEGEPPLAVRAWREALRSSDAVFMAAPEYGHSLPGALKNAVDWIFASGELYRKPVAVTASSPGPERGRRGLAALCQTLGALEAAVIGGEPIARGPGTDAAAARLLAQLVAAAQRVRAGQPALPEIALPPFVEDVLRGTSLRGPLLTRLGAYDLAAPPTSDEVLAALAALLADSVGGAPLDGPGLALARLDAWVDGSEGARALLDSLVGRLDESPALHALLAALGPRALACLG